MLKSVVDVGVPALVFFGMVVVGMGLTVDDFRRVARNWRTVSAATLGQIVLLPVIGWLLVRCFGLESNMAQGVLLVAACPSGTMANIYAYLARANVALSVTLTAVSCLLAIVTTPLIMSVLQSQAGESAGFSVPIGLLTGQMCLLLLFPVLIGMGTRSRWPEITERHARRLLGFSIACLAALLAFVIVQEAEHFADALGVIALTTASLTVLAFASGWAMALFTADGPNDRFAVGMVFVVRNVGIATAIAVTVLGKAEFAVFGTAYFLAQTPILLLAVLAFRWMYNGGGPKLVDSGLP
jgi:bile acid:Na+ symporter, BASS family